MIQDMPAADSNPARGNPPARGLTGRLLVASPRLDDPNFRRTVVLVLDHGTPGALGVVLNRPTEVPVEAILEPWHDQALLSPPGMMFRGGPVARDAIIGLGRVLDPLFSAEQSSQRSRAFLPEFGQEEGEVSGEDDEERIGVREVLGSVDTVDLSILPEHQPYLLGGIRLFSGYAGWGAAQLETEIADGAWFVLEAQPEDAFVSEPGLLWRDVLRRQTTRLAILSTYPEHPSTN
jgi:putative transcriptional regulator